MSSQALTANRRLTALRDAPAVPALLLAMLLWGATYVVGKVALSDAGPFAVLFLRLVVGALALYPFARRRGFVWRMALERRFILFGVTGWTLHLGFEILGLDFTSASSAALIIATAPAVTTAFAIAFLGERVTPRAWIGIAASVAGVVLVTGGQPQSAGSAPWVGNLLVFMGVVMWGIYTVQGRRMPTHEPSIVATTAGTAAGALVVLPATALEVAVQGPPAFTATGALAVIYLGLAASAAAYGLWNLALKHIGAATAAPFINLVPVIGVALALLAGDTMTPLQWLGAAVVAGGVALTQKG